MNSDSTAAPPPPPAPNKYDRQLRLWGAAGQAALGEACVILLQATAAGCETVKNLILPGIGGCIVVDDAPSVTQQDVAANFFVTCDNTSKPNDYNNNSFNSRGAVAARLLGELNPDVCVQHVFLSPSSGGFHGISDWKSFLEQDVLDLAKPSSPKHSHQFKRICVVASDLEPCVLLQVSQACWDMTNTTVNRNHTASTNTGGTVRPPTPLLAVQTYGLIGTLRVQTTPLALLHPQPRATRPDWRIAQPFPALQQFFDTFPQDLVKQLDSKALGHVPYPVILYQALQRWYQQSPQQPEQPPKPPKTFAEKQKFVQIIKDMLSSSSYAYADYLNFQEAVQNAYLAYTQIDVDIDALLVEAQTAAKANKATVTATSTGTNSSNSRLDELVVILQAIQDFVLQHKGALPLAGRTLPDLPADTASYVQLQRIYRTQAQYDLQQLLQLIRSHIEKQQGATNMPSTETVMAVCQNLPHVQIYTSTTINDEFNRNKLSFPPPPQIVQELQMAVMEVSGDDDDNDDNMENNDDDIPLSHTYEMLPLWWYWGVRACHDFFLEQGRYPGTTGTHTSDCTTKQMTKDTERVQSLWLSLLETYQITIPSSSLASKSNDFAQKVAMEMVRYGAADVHNIAAVIGGVASQEAVKLITGQYVPLKNTYVYNGIASVGGVYEF
jgi:amyloid beta precursor protein binding protein 1